MPQEIKKKYVLVFFLKNFGYFLREYTMTSAGIGNVDTF